MCERYFKNEEGMYYIGNFGITYDSKNKCFCEPVYDISKYFNNISFSL